MKIRPSHVVLGALAALSLAACNKPAAPADNTATAATADNSAMNAAANTAATNATSSDNSAATNTGAAQ